MEQLVKLNTETAKVALLECETHCIERHFGGFFGDRHDRTLWQEVLHFRDDHDYVPRCITRAEVISLDILARLAGGWYAWNLTKRGPVFVGMSNWKRRHARWMSDYV